MENFKRGSILMQEKLRLSKSQGASTPAELKRIQNVTYASAVGSIIYVELRVSCYTDAGYLTDADDLKSQTGYVFVLNGGAVESSDMKRELRVSCYTDAGYLTDADNLKSQTGYVFVLNGGVVDWKRLKAEYSANSSTMLNIRCI
ncbi:hypothetical protein Tco_1398941 [Tanacetum coccineum]